MDARLLVNGRHVCAWALLVLAWLHVPSALARGSGDAEPPLQPVEFNIPAGNAASSLNEFSRQAGLQLLFDFDKVRRLETRAAVGRYLPTEALRRMLVGTGLGFDFVNPRTLAISPVPPQSAREVASKAPEPPRRQTVPRREVVEPVIAATDERPMAEVRITGTNFFGESPVGRSLITIDRADIHRSGAVTLPDLVGTLPQNFGGGATEDTREVGREANTNASRGVALNLRGLGAGATLALLDGRRLAPGGTDGLFADISNIPLSAVERVDVLPDGASAVYGSDAIGGVVNFVLREPFDGAETQVIAGGAADGARDEYLVSQLLGTRWEGGNGMVAFEFHQKDPLAAADRAQATSDLRALGGDNFNTPLSNPGTLIAGGQTWAIPAGQDGTSLTAADFVPGTQNLQDRFTNADMLYGQKRWSAMARARHGVRDNVSLFTDVLASRREASARTSGLRAQLVVPETNPFYVNPTGGAGPVEVLYDFTEDLGVSRVRARVDMLNAAAGLDVDTPGGWHINGYFGYAAEEQQQAITGLVDFTALTLALADPDPATAFNPFGDGSYTAPRTLAAIRSSSRFTARSSYTMGSVSAEGTVFRLPAGDVKLALGADYRAQAFDTAATAQGVGNDISRDVHRTAGAAFGEILAPVVGPDNRLPAVQRLELSAAARYEGYSDFGGRVTPQLGLVWFPLGSLALRSTWGESLKAPNLVDLSENNNRSIPTQIADPLSNIGASNVLAWVGGNRDLREETARSWTLGIEYAPDALPGLSLALTHFDIEFTDRIREAEFQPDFLLRPEYAHLVTRNPTPQQLAEICGRSAYLFGSYDDCISTDPDAILDLRFRNIATLRTRGLDVNAAYRTDRGVNSFELSLNGTYIRDFEEALTPDAPLVQRVDTQNNPIDFRLRASATWKHRNVRASGFLHHADGYDDTISIPNRRVRSWTTLDMQLAYETEESDHAWFGGSTLALTVQNVLDQDPPFLNNSLGIGYDPENADLAGRQVSVSLRKRW